MVNQRLFLRSQHDADRIDPQRCVSRSMFTNPCVQQMTQALNLLRSDGFERGSIPKAASSFHFDCDHGPALAHHKIEFAAATAAPVAIEQTAADALQIFDCKLFASGAEGTIMREGQCLLRVHAHSLAQRQPVNATSEESVGSSAIFQLQPPCGGDSSERYCSSIESSCGSLNSRAESSSTLTSLKVSTRTDFTKRSLRYTSHTHTSLMLSSK